MLTDTELSAMRETCEDAFPDSATVQRLSSTPDGIGGQTVTVASTHSLPCRIAEPSGRDRERAFSLQLDIERVMVFAHDGNLQATDRVVWSGKTYEILFLSKDRSWCLTGIAFLGNAT